MVERLNHIRYIVAVLLPLVILVYFNAQIFIITELILLLINNIIDDVVFWYGSATFSIPEHKSEIMSPVNGTVVEINKKVRIFDHLTKVDIITSKELLKFINTGIQDDKSLYTHISIFLNKFNNHAVTNIGSIIKNVRLFNQQGELVEMVEDGSILPQKQGRYLNNSFVMFEYANGAKAVFTLDKYVSKYKIIDDKKSLIDMLICRGSQCDLYIPLCYEIEVSEGECIHNFQCISEELHDEIETNQYKTRRVVLRIIRLLGVRPKSIILCNLSKTLQTNIVSNPLQCFVLILVAIFFPQYLLYVIALLLSCFYYEREGKHLLYTHNNRFGYSKILSNIYKSLYIIKTWQVKVK